VNREILVFREDLEKKMDGMVRKIKIKRVSSVMTFFLKMVCIVVLSYTAQVFS